MSSDDEDLAQVYVWNTVKNKEDIPLFVLATDDSSHNSDMSSVGNRDLVKHAFPQDLLVTDIDPQTPTPKTQYFRPTSNIWPICSPSGC